MADNYVVNKALVEGLYTTPEGTMALNADTELSVLMVDIDIVKTADMQVWATGPLTYTITITNNGDNDYTGLSFTDTIDTTKVAFVNNSVKINGTPTTDYTYTAPNLTMDLDDLAPLGNVAISFQVTKL